MSVTLAQPASRARAIAARVSSRPSPRLRTLEDAHVVDPSYAAVEVDVEHHMAGDDPRVADDEVVDVAAEHRLVLLRGVREIAGAVRRLLHLVRRLAHPAAWVEAHPVGLPAVLEAELDQAPAERLVRSQRPAADLANARVASDPNGTREIGTGIGKGKDGIAATEEDGHPARVDPLPPTTEPRAVTRSGVGEHT